MNERNKTAVLSRPKSAYEDKIRALLDEMTLEEKISQICESWGIAGAERVGVPPLYKGAATKMLLPASMMSAISCNLS